MDKVIKSNKQNKLILTTAIAGIANKIGSLPLQSFFLKFSK